MGFPTSPKVMVSNFLLLIVCLLLCLPFVSTVTLKSRDHHYDDKLQKWIPCSKCSYPEIIRKPCQVHQDTECGPVPDITKVFGSEIVPESTNPHRHERHKKHHKHRGEGEMRWVYGDDVGKQTEPPPRAEEVISPDDQPFTRMETLVWDWQAIALSTAVFACILFFLVITLYSLHQVKQWRRLKESFEADVEELSASLMVAVEASAAASKAKKLDDDDDDERPPRMPDAATAAVSVGATDAGNYLNRCVYLEQLLNVRKDKKSGPENGGNVYIEGSTNQRAAPNQKTRKT